MAFGWEPPVLVHMPLILAPGGGKLSKRHGATAMEEFRANGYLPEALMNYLALLGWSYDATTELFSKEDLLEKFTLERVSPSPATFDYAKLQWFNQYYINHILTLDDLTDRVIPFLVNAGLADAAHPDRDQIREAVALLKDRLETLAEAPELMSYFLREELEPYDPELLVPKKMEPADTLKVLNAVQEDLAALDVADEEAVEARFRARAEALEYKTGDFFMPVRVAVTGRTKSPGLFGTLRVIGNDRVRTRIASAITLLQRHEAQLIAGT
jgi:glutamyl-tRNA synthetase